MIHHGDCRAVMASFEPDYFDAIVTDPPYGLEFMGEDWDAPKPGWDPRGQGAERGFAGKDRAPVGGFDAYRAGAPFQAWCLEWATEAFRVLKPGGHLVAFGGTRTYHRLACAIEDAGFEIRDSLHWLYGSGFPKSLDVSKAIDKAAADNSWEAAAAETWDGWGTALKPGHEPIVLARKPFRGTVVQNVLEHGTGALNVDGCRVSGPKGAGVWGTSNAGRGVNETVRLNASPGREDYRSAPVLDDDGRIGRWPPNVLLDDGAAAEVDRQAPRAGGSGPASGPTHAGASERGSMAGGFGGMGDRAPQFHDDEGGASRFYPVFRYEAKAPSSERPSIPAADGSGGRWGASASRCSKCGRQAVNRPGSECSCDEPDFQPEPDAGTIAHPTVKPVDLMRWLARLVTPKGGLVLDPFAGSGTTAQACIIEGFEFVLIEQDARYVALIEARLSRDIQPVLL